MRFAAVLTSTTNGSLMKLFLLSLNYPERGRSYEQFVEFLMRAADEQHARTLAAAFVRGETQQFPNEHEIAGWTDPSRTTCLEVHEAGKPGIVASNFRHG
jgi:hypothetical protein